MNIQQRTGGQKHEQTFKNCLNGKNSFLFFFQLIPQDIGKQ